MRAVAALFLAVVLCVASTGCSAPASSDEAGAGERRSLQPARQTEPVAHDPDDPAIWVHPTRPQNSLILGTDKVETQGALYVFGLDGRIRQTIGPLDRPNNVDVEYGFALGGRAQDIAVVTERKRRCLRVYGISADTGRLVELSSGGIPVLEGQSREAAEPMGIALYRRPRDGAVFAIVAPKTGGSLDYLWQYELQDDGAGRVAAQLVRRFGAFSGRASAAGEEGEIEAVAVDDALGYVYYSDEALGIRKYRADPNHPDAASELAVFGHADFVGDREGIGIYDAPGGAGLIVVSDQRPGATVLRLFRREGRPDAPHQHDEVGAITTTADDTDGIDVTAQVLPGFPQGLLVVMNSGPRNFLIYRWEDVMAALGKPGSHRSAG